MKKLTFLFLLALSVLVASCVKDEDGEKREKEKKLIENYVLTHNITVTPSSTGLYFIPDKQGYGTSPTYNDYAIIEYKITDLEGKFYDGTDKALVEQNKIYPYFALGGPLKIYAGPGGFYAGIIEGLKQMKEGGTAKMIMPSLLADNDYVPKIIEVELIRVISNPMMYEREQIINFLDTATNNTISLSDSTSGIYYIEKQAGTGVTPVTGNLVNIKYKAYLTDGRIFDKTETDKEYQFYVGNNDVIVGLDNGIRLMKKGGKATMLIPYYSAYGIGQRIMNSQVVIPLFSTVVFDVELTNIAN